MNRGEMHAQKRAELFVAQEKQVWSTQGINQDQELTTMLYDFIYGEALYHGQVSPKMRQYAILACLVTKSSLKQLRTQIDIALNMGITPSEVKEVIYQCASYVGFDNSLDAMDVANEVFATHGYNLPIKSQATVTDETRYYDGYTVQKGIFGDVIDNMKNNTPEYKRYIIVNYLSSLCFGGFYTRKGLSLQEREIVTFTAIATMNPLMNQVKDHMNANLAVGNTKQDLVDIIGHCVAYLGFPRALTLLAILDQVAPEKE